MSLRAPYAIFAPTMFILVVMTASAQEQDIPCPDSMANVTASDLAKCITSLKQSIYDLRKSRNSLQIETYGQVGSDGVSIKSGGSTKTVVEKKEPGTYDVRYTASLSYVPTVIVGSTKHEEFVGAYVVRSNELGFTVEGKNTGLNPKATGFWYIVIK